MRRVPPAQGRLQSFHEIATPNRTVLVDGMMSVCRLRQRQTQGALVRQQPPEDVVREGQHLAQWCTAAMVSVPSVLSTELGCLSDWISRRREPMMNSDAADGRRHSLSRSQRRDT